MPGMSELHTTAVSKFIAKLWEDIFMDHFGARKASSPSLQSLPRSCAASIADIHGKDAHQPRQFSLFLGILSKHCISLNQRRSDFLSLS